MTDQHRHMRAEYKIRRDGTTNLSDVLMKIRADGWKILDYDIDSVQKETGKKRYINIKCMERIANVDPYAFVNPEKL